MSASHWNKVMRLCAEWPVDQTKGGRELATALRLYVSQEMEKQVRTTPGTRLRGVDLNYINIFTQLDNEENFDEYQDEYQEYQDGSDEYQEYQDGSDEYQDEYQDGSDEYQDEYQEYQDGSDEYQDGSDEYQDEYQEYQDGSDGRVPRCPTLIGT
uniref:Mitochondrial protein M19 n=1 Tax=Eptatretus burgeri TaxID=7764 RepID=A0A8C4QRH3_EPTBU